MSRVSQNGGFCLRFVNLTTRISNNLCVHYYFYKEKVRLNVVFFVPLQTNRTTNYIYICLHLNLSQKRENE